MSEELQVQLSLDDSGPQATSQLGYLVHGFYNGIERCLRSSLESRGFPFHSLEHFTANYLPTLNLS